VSDAAKTAVRQKSGLRPAFSVFIQPVPKLGDAQGLCLDSLVIRIEGEWGLDMKVMAISDILLLNMEHMFHYDVDRNGECACGE